MNIRWSICCLVVAVFMCLVLCASAPDPVTTASPDECSNFSGAGKCDECVKALKGKCFYCKTDNKCQLYPVKELLPTKECDLGAARWGTCAINFKALIISMSVIAGVLILSICCGVYCCCCRSKGNRAKWAREDAKVERQKEERKMKHEQKKQERKAKNDEIRRKYGLLKEEDDDSCTELTLTEDV
ncbi:pituitary tumor-transforming gene 1 protein-interacting protein-like isoform X1 [Amphiura filiformis]|uniref:pituitary tumor-transforming gene 1 protein-interacting protein-like isoform X1 n=1 Tax=Amphiura filiformis TaxID=82378 RepID=UPI003B225761